VKRGDYQLIRAEDNGIIEPSELTGMVQSGVVLEMSIVLWRLWDKKKKCPRCGHIDKTIVVSDGWVEWKVF
jgi:hypothetical protein